MSDQSEKVDGQTSGLIAALQVLVALSQQLIASKALDPNVFSKTLTDALANAKGERYDGPAYRSIIEMFRDIVETSK